MTPAFLAASLVVVATPGTGVVFTVSAGLLRGRRGAVLAAAACTAGVLPHLAVAVTGLAALLSTSGPAHALLTWAGIAYLLHLAVRTWSDPGSDLVRAATTTTTTTTTSSASSVTTASSAPSGALPVRPARVLRDGVVLNLLNPKLTLFFVAFLPQFVAPGADAGTTTATLGVVFMVVSFVVFAGYGLAATSLRPLLRDHPRVAGRAGRAFAVTYVLVAAALAAGQLAA